ncbi:MAG: fumarylacetoacetate hydrolase family protein, partial [bacterium]
MRIATYQGAGEPRLGFVVNDRIVDLQALARRKKLSVPKDMVMLIEETPTLALRALGREADAWVKAGRESSPVSKTKLLAPIPRPAKNIFCMGRNYAEHAREGGVAPPEVPVFFTKPPTTVIG